MKIFQPTYKDKETGATKEAQRWYIDFIDNHRRRRRLPAYPVQNQATKRATERAMARIEDLLAGGPLSPEVQRWLGDIPDAMRLRLVEWGLLDAARWSGGRGKPLDGLLTAYADYLRVVKGDTGKYVEHVISQLIIVFKGCGFKMAEDIKADVIEAWLIKQRTEGEGYRGEKGWSVRTVNSHITSLRGFAKWIVRKKKALDANPVDAVDTFTSHETDIRCKRRALRTSEIFRLLRTTAEQNIVREGMDGNERALLYEFAIKVGARVNAIRHLRPCDFDFECEGGATVRLLAEHSKTHTAVVQPLEADLAAKVKQFIQDRTRQVEDLVFHGTYQTLTVDTARIIKEDAEAAQVAYKTDEGLIDFHALKHTYASSLRGMDDTDKMALTGHKTRDMLSRYDHRSLEDKRALLSRVQVWGMAG